MGLELGTSHKSTPIQPLTISYIYIYIYIVVLFLFSCYSFLFACIHGLDEVMIGELVEFEEGTIGIALNLESNNVGVVFMGDGLMIQ